MTNPNEFGGLDSEMPPGTPFVYLGRPCVVKRYADIGEAQNSEHGYFGIVYDYADERGKIHTRCIAPRDIDGFRKVVVRQ